MKALPNQTRAAQCEGKEAFTSAVLAKQVAKNMGRRGRVGANAYHCPYCHEWHVGTHKAIKRPRFYGDDE